MPPIRRWEVFRPSRATADRAACGRGAPQEPDGAGNAPERSGGQPRAKRSARRGRKAPRAPTRRPRSGSALTEGAERHSPHTDRYTPPRKHVSYIMPHAYASGVGTQFTSHYLRPLSESVVKYAA